MQHFSHFHVGFEAAFLWSDNVESPNIVEYVTWKKSCDLETKFWTGNKAVTWKQICDLETKLSPGCKVVTWKQSCDLEITSSNKEYPTMKTCVTNVMTWVDSWFWFPKSRIFHIKKLALTIEIIYFGCSNTSAI